jgi:uncharacterized membrane-anchored protein
MKSRSLLLALLLPAIVLLGWVTRLELRRQQGQEVVLAVQAYDPRDMLSGHYLQYAVDYGFNPCELKVGRGDSSVCVCLEAPSLRSDVWRAGWSGECSALPDECATHLRGSCEYSRFTAGIERFYIPEAYAPKLTRVPPNATITVRVAGDGSAQVTDLLVNGAPLSQYVAEQSP